MTVGEWVLGEEKEAIFALTAELAAIDGPAGFEGPVVRRLVELLRPLADEVTVDRFGNVIATRHGRDGAGSGPVADDRRALGRDRRHRARLRAGRHDPLRADRRRAGDDADRAARADQRAARRRRGARGACAERRRAAEGPAAARPLHRPRLRLGGGDAGAGDQDRRPDRLRERRRAPGQPRPHLRQGDRQPDRLRPAGAPLRPPAGRPARRHDPRRRDRAGGGRAARRAGRHLPPQPRLRDRRGYPARRRDARCPLHATNWRSTSGPGR